MNKLHLLLTLPLLIVLAACSSEPDEPPAPEPDKVAFEAEEINVPPAGGDIVIRLSANKEWKIEIPGNREFLNGYLHTENGEAGEHEILYTAHANTGSASRTTTLTLSGGRAEPVSLVLCQNAMDFEIPSEDEVRAFLIRLFEETDGPNWRFKGKWGSDLPLNKWGSEVKYENGRLELNLGEHYMKGKVNLSGCKAFVRLRCAKNQITEIDVSDCPLLEYVDATSTGITKINFDRCYSLKQAWLGYNNLSELDLGWSTTLEEISIEHNRLTSIDLSRCVSLKELNCANNRLGRLEIPYRSKLTSLWCYENELRSLDLSGAEWLSMFNCGANAIENLDISGCKRLAHLWCYSNRLKELDYTDSKESLVAFYCFSNKLKKINVSGFRRLHELHCSDNDITEINITGCKGLGWLYCAYNQIEDIDFTGLDLDIVCRIDVTGNNMLAVDLKPFVHLFHLWCKDTKTGGEIPLLFDQFEDFEHRLRYEYLPGSGSYIDRGFGWWYPGEPEKGSHTR